MIGHVTPEAKQGGVLAIVRNGDVIKIDKKNQTLNVELSDAEIEARKKVQNKSLHSFFLNSFFF